MSVEELKCVTQMRLQNRVVYVSSSVFYGRFENGVCWSDLPKRVPLPCHHPSRIPRICEFSIFHYSICLTNTIIMYMMVSLPHRRSTELIWRPPLITAFWRVKKRDYHFWCRSYSMNTIDIELAHAMLDLHHWFSNCCLYGIFIIPVSIHRWWNRWIRVIASMSWQRCMYVHFIFRSFKQATHVVMYSSACIA